MLNISKLSILSVSWWLAFSPSLFATEELPFWRETPAEPRMRWTPTSDSGALNDWQVKYALKTDLTGINVGGIFISPQSSFLQNLQPDQNGCTQVTKKTLYDSVQIERCALSGSDTIEQRVSVGGIAARESATVLLSAEKETVISVRLAQDILKVSLKAPTLESVDVHRDAKGWQFLARSSNPQKKVDWFWGATFPTKEVLFKRQFKSSVLDVKGSFGIKYQMSLQELNKAHRVAERHRIINPRPLVTYNTDLTFKTKKRQSQEVKTYTLTDLRKGFWKNYEVDGYRVRAMKMPKHELSMRLSAIQVGTSTILTLVDLTAVGFVESIFNRDFESFWTHRLGYKIRAFSAVSELSKGELKTPQPLSLVSAEARMNMNQGIWNYNELFGLQLATYQLQITNAQQSYLGFGFYWARSMPEVSDRPLRNLKWFRYPKYVDMNLTLIPPIGGKGPSANSPGVVLEFHGKMFYNENFYLEYGFGYLRLQLQPSSLYESTLQTFISTFGVGWTL